MTNREYLESLSDEELAKNNVKSFSYMSGYSFRTDFYATDYSIFDIRKEAEEYELNWLRKEKMIQDNCIECEFFNKEELKCEKLLCYVCTNDPNFINWEYDKETHEDCPYSRKDL